MDELRLKVLQLIEESKAAYTDADECGYKSHKEHYGNRIKKLNKVLKILR